MTTSSKGKAEKHRLHTYVPTTVLDKYWKGTTEQFIILFNEQFRQLDEVSPPEESLPYTTGLTLLQTAVHNIPELRMVETMEEFISLSSSMDLPWDKTTTSLYSKMLASDIKHVEKPLFSIGLISSCADQFSSCALLQSKIACLHVSFTTYEYFYKLSKSASFS